MSAFHSLGLAEGNSMAVFMSAFPFSVGLAVGNSMTVAVSSPPGAAHGMQLHQPPAHLVQKLGGSGLSFSGGGQPLRNSGGGGMQSGGGGGRLAPPYFCVKSYSRKIYIPIKTV